MIKLAHCVITKGDEELKQLQVLFSNLKGIFNSVHITANGKKVEETKKWCEENGFDFSFLPWGDDFSAQRNFNFSRVPKNTDYIVWSDSDDVIVNPHLLLEIAEKAKKQGLDVVYFDYWYGARFEGKPSLKNFREVEITHKRERLIRPGSIIWKKRIHETPVPVDPENFRYSGIPYSEKYPIAWLHLGADRDLPPEKMAQRMARNRRLLELQLEEERKEGNVDPRTILYLMKIYVEEENPALWKQCFSLGQEYLEKSGWDEERAVCYRLMSLCAGKLGDHQTAKKLLFKAIEEFPHDPLLYLYLARVYFNLKNFSAMKRWLEFGLSLGEDRSTMKNLLELKTLSAELMLEYYFYGDKKDVRKAWKAAKILADLVPTKENKGNELYLYELKRMDEASEAIHKLFLYYEEIEREDLIEKLYLSLPPEIQRLPFANYFYNKYKEPKIWGKDEICYYASLGGPHFEKWSPKSLKTGIGGSETAVIRLTQEWAKMGWKVTVYADCGLEEGVHDGVLWLPYWKFNPRDYFNIFIQWRGNSLAGKINAKLFLVDLHDVFVDKTVKEKENQVDFYMVKSNYHRKFGYSLPDNKFKIISNGI